MRHLCITSLLIIILFFGTGCSNINEATGKIVAINEQNIEILLMNDPPSGKNENAIGKVLTIAIDDHTMIVDQLHQNVSLEVLKVGHMIRVLDIKTKNENHIAGEIQLLGLTSDDLISSMLAPADKYHIFVIANSKDEQTPEVFDSLLSEYSIQRYNFSLTEFDPNHPYDIIQILDLERLPAYLVLDSKGLLAKYYDENNLRDYMNQLSE